MSFVAPRLPPHSEQNALTRAVSALREAGMPFVDLTDSNPTRVSLSYPRDLLASLADPGGLDYDPQPFGMATARAAVAADISRRGRAVDPGHVILTASTSEAYAWLFKLLCGPADCVLVPRPSYPLFDHLTRLESVRAVPYDLDNHGRWTLDFETVMSAPLTTRALLLVTPNNPTGSYISESELARAIDICQTRGWALIADEVFADYPLDAPAPVTDIAVGSEVLSFTLAGVSKTLCLPQLKLGWIVVGGPAEPREAALAGLELIADTYLSVGTPIQVAVPELFHRAAPVRHAAHARVRANLSRVRAAAASFPACDVLRVEGGWSAVIRVPAIRGEEQLVLELLQEERILVHPGYYFDFQTEAFLVVSLLVPEARMDEAIARALRFASQ